MCSAECPIKQKIDQTSMEMKIIGQITGLIREITDIRDHIDTEKAAESIRSNIYFKGPNVWILVCAIVLASVGLNVNSTAVIIGAMLVSPLMGPIIGIGLGLGTNDTALIKSAFKNLLVMMSISVVAATVYFLVTPLKLANPTELLARTNPTIYDVMIALFGGLAGIFELSRKEKGTVISGVAIATALMPPLCTAGYGIASGSLNYFLGALYLFVINCIFIVLATYIMVKYLNFSGIEFQDNKKEKRTKTLITAIVILFIVPSILSAMSMIRENRFKIEVEAFIAENKNLEKGYIYDYRINTRKGRSVEVFIAGDPMTASEKSRLMESAERHGISEGQIRFSERKLSDNEGDASETLMKGIYARTDQEISKREKRIADLENELSAYRSEEIPYARIVREIKSQYPSVTGIFIGKGAAVQADSLSLRHGIAVIADYDGKISEEECRKLEEWLRIRLEDDSLTVVHRFHENPGKTR